MTFKIEKGLTAFQKVYTKTIDDLKDPKKDKNETILEFLKFLGYNEIVNIYNEEKK